MGEHEEKIEIMRKYLTDMSTDFTVILAVKFQAKKLIMR